MILSFTIFHIFVLIVSPISPPLASAQDKDGTIARDGCNSTCGTVSIPFPFGMHEPNCYADKWFEIECKFDNNASSDVPYLKSLNLEVDRFYNNMVVIMNPIYRSNCRHKDKTSSSRNKTVTLRGSPFVYSQAENSFLAVGCNILAFLQSNGTTVGGCMSIGPTGNNNININISRCSCVTSVPPRLSEFNAMLRGLTDQSSDGCSYALITNDNRMPLENSNDMNTDEIEMLNDLKNMEYAPVMLEWEILNYMLINSTFQLPPNCYDSNVTSLSNNRTTGRQCQCLFSSNGNPYLAGGCPGFSISSFLYYKVFITLVNNSKFQLSSDSVCYYHNYGISCECFDGYSGNPFHAGGCRGFSTSYFFNYYMRFKL